MPACTLVARICPDRVATIEGEQHQDQALNDPSLVRAEGVHCVYSFAASLFDGLAYLGTLPPALPE